MAHSHGDDSVALLELENEVLQPYWADVMDWLGQAVPSADRIVDLGAGTGTGTVELARRYADAEILAVDASEQMLHRIRIRTDELDLSDRVQTLQSNLDDTWPTVEPVDLTWASMSMHHFADPDRVLRDVFTSTRARGHLAVAELGEPLRFLPGELDGLEQRCEEAFRAEHAYSLPYLGSAWAPRMTSASFEIVDERTFTVDLRPPTSPTVGEFAHAYLTEMRHGVAHRLTQHDRNTLTDLLDDTNSLQHRTDLHLRGSRIVTLARRQ